LDVDVTEAQENRIATSREWYCAVQQNQLNSDIEQEAEMLAEIISTITTSLSEWWHDFHMTPEERWLSQSADVGELEARLRRLATKDTSFNNFITGTR